MKGKKYICIKITKGSSFQANEIHGIWEGVEFAAISTCNGKVYLSWCSRMLLFATFSCFLYPSNDISFLIKFKMNLLSCNFAIVAHFSVKYIWNWKSWMDLMDKICRFKLFNLIRNREGIAFLLQFHTLFGIHNYFVDITAWYASCCLNWISFLGLLARQQDLFDVLDDSLLLFFPPPPLPDRVILTDK